MADEHDKSTRKGRTTFTRKKRTTFTPTTTTSSKLTIAATTVLLNDAKEGFKVGNFVCSPFSLEILLGMVAAGAEGETLKQLLEFLGCETVEQLLYDSKSSKLCKILSSLKGDESPSLICGNFYPKEVDISLANGVWCAKKLSAFQTGYKDILESVYKTKPVLLDFENEPDEAVEEINSWVDKKTKGLIPTIVEKSDICQDRNIKIIFVNALYFQGSWYDKFLETKEKDFHLINGEKKIVSVPFMSRFGSSEYGSFINYKILKLPYASVYERRKFSMYIFLPHKIDGLQDLLQMFHSDPELFGIRYDLELRCLDELWIPKFKISNTFEAHDVMTQMGLTLPFERTNMELTQVIESRCLDVPKILQKSYIEIDENGTKAAECCYIRSSGGDDRPSFVADHPFMFMIREDTSQTVTLLGVVLNPLA